jgi:hypothetical protein
MRGNAALRIAITGANGNIGRKLIAAFFAVPDIAVIHAIDRDVASLAPHDARLFPIRTDLRGRCCWMRLRAWTQSFIWPRRIPIRTPHGKMRALPLI